MSTEFHFEELELTGQNGEPIGPLLVGDGSGKYEPLLVSVATQFSAAIEACKDLDKAQQQSIIKFIKDNSDFIINGINDLINSTVEKAEQIDAFVHNMISQIDLDSLSTNAHIIIDILSKIIN